MEFVVVASLTLILSGAGYFLTRSYRQTSRLIQQIKAQNLPILYHDQPWQLSRYEILNPGDKSRVFGIKSGLLVITEKRLTIYQSGKQGLMAEIAVAPGEIMGYWRPEKYSDERNVLWIHVRIGNLWQVIHIHQRRSNMTAIIRAFKRIATEEQTSAYRRQRPYIHRGITPVHPAIQNLQGAWELSDPVDLYLMPLYLVIMEQGEVQQVIHLRDIQQITALRRMDTPAAEGLLRFVREDTGQTMAFALKDYDAWATDLATAAKRTLESPVTRKQKTYEDEDE